MTVCGAICQPLKEHDEVDTASRGEERRAYAGTSFHPPINPRTKQHIQ